MTIRDIQERISQFDPTTETSVDEIKITEEGGYRRIAFIPVNVYEVQSFLAAARFSGEAERAIFAALDASGALDHYLKTRTALEQVED